MYRTPNIKLTQQSWHKQHQQSSQNVDQNNNNNNNRSPRFKPPPMQPVFNKQPYGTNNQYNTHAQSNSHQHNTQQNPMSQDVRKMPQCTSNYNHNRTNIANHVHLITYPPQQNVKRNYFFKKNAKNHANEIKRKFKINGKVVQFLLDTGCLHSVINESVINHNNKSEENVIRPLDSIVTTANGGELQILGVNAFTFRSR
jgi:hypothetical protein